MEILEYLRVGALRGRWLAVVVAVPVLAGALAFVLGTRDPATYVASARVAVVEPGDVADGGRAAVDRAEVAFETVFESSELADDVAAELGPSPRGVSSMAATPTGTGFVQVSLRAADAGQAETALAAAAAGALRSMLEVERETAAARAAAARSTLDRAREEAAALHLSFGTPDIDAAVDRLELGALALRTAVATTSDPAVTAAFEAELRRNRAERDLLAPALVEQRRQADRVARAQVVAEETAARLSGLDAALDALAVDPPVLVAAQTTPAAQVTELALLAIVAMAASSVLVLAVFARSTRRRPRRPGAGAVSRH